MIKLFYAFAILVQILLAFLTRDKNRNAYMWYQWETILGLPNTPKGSLFPTLMCNYWKITPEGKNNESSLLLEG